MNLQALQYRRTSHFLHAIMFLLTWGLRIFPWVWFTVSNRNYNQRIDLAVMAQEDRRQSGNRREEQRAS